MVLAIVLIVIAILLGLGGLLFTALKWLLIVAAVVLVVEPGVHRWYVLESDPVGDHERGIDRASADPLE